MDEEFLRSKLRDREAEGLLRTLRAEGQAVDFFSNDYLGIVRNGLIQLPALGAGKWHGSTGSRLLSGNYPLIEKVEKDIAAFHGAPAGLLFTSGYDANLGLLASVAARGDLIVYDFLSHASIRDGARLSLAESVSFQHNDLIDLRKKLQLPGVRKFVVTESVFSMDGDIALLKEIAEACAEFGAALIVDEAHATGVVGERGEGLVHTLDLQGSCFARIHTFGKAVGAHGAIVLGSEDLRQYLINYCRPFIYTTALPASSVTAISHAYAQFPTMNHERKILAGLISSFRTAARLLTLTQSTTPIQSVVIPGNDRVREVAERIQQAGFDVRPILSPTVPRGGERIRVVLHSFNTTEEVDALTGLFNKFV